MDRCLVCNRRVAFSSRKAEGAVFCSNYCFTYSEMPGFCQRCAAETTSNAPGNTHMSSLGGSLLVGAKARCEACHSIVQRKIYFVFVIPVWRGPKYRVIYTNHTSYVGRELKESAAAAVDPG